MGQCAAETVSWKAQGARQLLITAFIVWDPGAARPLGFLQQSVVSWRFVTDATVVISITFLMFIMPSQRPQLRPWAQDLQGAEEGIAARQLKEQPSARLLEWTLVQQKVPWNVVLLLGGGFALARGCEESGLSRWLGNQLLPLQNIPPWSIAAVLCLLIAICTECTSNVATATLFLPILASMMPPDLLRVSGIFRLYFALCPASLIRMNPLYVMIPGTLSTSFAFMLPVATPPNAIVFSYGQLRVSDMVKAGIALNLIGVASVTLAINTWGRAMFSLDTFPAWANTSHSL